MAQRWLDDNYNSKARAGAFFASIGLLMIQIGINVVDNAFSAGMDMASLFSQYINIRRGAYIALLISLCMCPWQLLSSAAVFISVLSAYSVFLGPVIGIQICDYWVIRRRRIKLSDLYHPRPDGIYYFVRGINPRSFVAWLIGFAAQLPGFAAAVTPDRVRVGKAWNELFYMAFPLGLVLSFTAHYIFSKIWPPHGVGEVDDVDCFGTFEPEEAMRLGIAPASDLDTEDVVTEGIEEVMSGTSEKHGHVKV